MRSKLKSCEAQKEYILENVCIFIIKKQSSSIPFPGILAGLHVLFENAVAVLLTCFAHLLLWTVNGSALRAPQRAPSACGSARPWIFPLLSSGETMHARPTIVHLIPFLCHQHDGGFAFMALFHCPEYNRIRIRIGKICWENAKSIWNKIILHL